MSLSPTDLKLGLQAAFARAQEFVGATSPNPPVGAVAWDSDGQVLGVSAHERAGTAHAEAGLLAKLREDGRLNRVHTLFITLEPCNHTGRTPPCTQAILNARVPQVIYGCPDPNRDVPGKGAETLKAAGVLVSDLSEMGPEFGEELRLCRELIRPWAHRLNRGYPFVVVKQALNPAGSMIPEKGQKTFTSESSLTLAHELRRQSDAILTGVGTVLADRPLFNVRRVADHRIVPLQKKRILVVLDRSGRTPADWVKAEEALGFEVWIRADLGKALRELGEKGANQVLVEAGPAVTQAVLQGGFCGKHVVIQAHSSGKPDSIKEDVYWNH